MILNGIPDSDVSYVVPSIPQKKITLLAGYLLWIYFSSFPPLCKVDRISDHPTHVSWMYHISKLTMENPIDQFTAMKWILRRKSSMVYAYYSKNKSFQELSVGSKPKYYFSRKKKKNELPEQGAIVCINWLCNQVDMLG